MVNCTSIPVARSRRLVRERGGCSGGRRGTMGLQTLCGFRRRMRAADAVSYFLMFALLLAAPTRAFFLAPTTLGRVTVVGCAQGKVSSLRPVMAYDIRYSPNKWKDEEIEPGFGGVWPGDPDAQTHNVKFLNKAGEQVAEMDVPVDRYIYFATEDAGIDLPIVNKKKMCRNGCCTTCAAKVLEGKVKHDGALGLLKDLKQEGYALMCCSFPKSDLIVELQEEDEVYMKQFGDFFEGGGVKWGGFFPEDD